MYNFISKNSGSALIITMLLVMVVSAIGLGSARLTLSEVNQSRKLEDSTGAYYAAYSGIEQGLLLFRFNHNIQLSQNCQDSANCHEIPTALDGTPVSFTYNNDPEARYDLKIYYKSNGGVGNFNNLTDTSNPILKKDNVIQLSNFDGVSTNGFAIKYITPCDDSTQTGGNCNIDTSSRPSGIAYGVEFKIMTFDNDGNTINTFSCLADQRSRFQAAGNSGITLADLNQLEGCKDKGILNSTTFNKNTIMQIIPYDTDIRYAVKATDSSGNAQNIDSGTTTIESTGYYGSTKRKLQVQVDRQTGTLLRTFDFVLYSGMGDINP